MKISRQQLRKLINEEARSVRPDLLKETVQTLNELYPGSQIGSFLKQGVTKLWEADHMFQKAIHEAPPEHMNELNAIHKELETLAFKVDGAMQRIMSGGKR